MDFTSPQPPAGLSAPQQALWWLKKGKLKFGPEWQAAHLICQRQEGTREYDLVHALAHWIEGDVGNRDYWYRRIAGWKRAETMEDEWDNVSRALA
jgi:hypothetical protein